MWIGEAVGFLARMVVRGVAVVLMATALYFGGAILAPAPQMVHIVSE